MKTLDNHEIKNKNIIFRADLNVPIFNRKITDYTRIESIIPSINKLLKTVKFYPASVKKILKDNFQNL